jgi:hypothetical protein
MEVVSELVLASLEEAVISPPAHLGLSLEGQLEAMEGA